MFPFSSFFFLRTLCPIFFLKNIPDFLLAHLRNCYAWLGLKKEVSCPKKVVLCGRVCWRDLLLTARPAGRGEQTHPNGPHSGVPRRKFGSCLFKDKKALKKWFTATVDPNKNIPIAKNVSLPDLIKRWFSSTIERNSVLSVNRSIPY